MTRQDWTRFLGAAAMLAFATIDAQAQATPSDNEGKILYCRENSKEIIFLSREQLREKCGIWASSNTTKTKTGEREQIVYNRYFLVYLDNGKVTSVRKRRQIFTGFRMKP